MIPPVAAATEVACALTGLFVMLLAAKLGDELFKRLGQPGIVGEIFAVELVCEHERGAAAAIAHPANSGLLRYAGLTTATLGHPSELRADGQSRDWR